MNGLKGRIERIQEQLNPTPPEMLCVIIRRFDSGEGPEAVKPPRYSVGKFATCCFLGGKAKERLAMLKRLRASGEYDTLPACSQAAIGESNEA